MSPTSTVIPHIVSAILRIPFHLCRTNGTDKAAHNPWPVQQVGTSTAGTSCLSGTQPQPEEFLFTLHGSTTQCGNSFIITWVDSVGVGPWTATILPLDGT